MEEKTFRLEVQHMLRSMGLWDYHPPDDTPVATADQISKIVKALKLDGSAFGIIRNILQPPTWRRESVSLSRPDIYALNPRGPTVVVECKMMKPKVKVESWLHPNEISDGQRSWLDSWCYHAGGPGFLAVCTADTPRQAWLVPWEEWVKMEKQLGEINIDFHIKVSNLEPEFELEWKGNGIWQPQQGHPIWAYPTEAASPNNIIGKTEPFSFRFTKKEEDVKQ